LPTPPIGAASSSSSEKSFLQTVGVAFQLWLLPVASFQLRTKVKQHAGLVDELLVSSLQLNNVQ
jgi:hypothetical protein